MTIVSYRKLFFDTFLSFEVKKHFLAYFYTHSLMNFILFVIFNEMSFIFWKQDVPNLMSYTMIITKSLDALEQDWWWFWTKQIIVPLNFVQILISWMHCIAYNCKPKWIQGLGINDHRNYVQLKEQKGRFLGLKEYKVCLQNWRTQKGISLSFKNKLHNVR